MCKKPKERSFSTCKFLKPGSEAAGAVEMAAAFASGEAALALKPRTWQANLYMVKLGRPQR
jgi:hypothetical protein